MSCKAKYQQAVGPAPNPGRSTAVPLARGTGMEPRKLKLSLLENSHAFMAEAARNAIAAREDIHRWQFALLNLVQAVELSLKELLRREHHLLIFDNIDTPKNTISLNQALSRIENANILGLTIPEEEKKKIKHAVSIRNKITHFEFEVSEEFAMARFSEIFAFLVYFQGRFLKVEVEDILSSDLLESVIELEKCFTELRHRALKRIEEEGLSLELAWGCLNCGEDTFIVEQGRNICFICRKTDEVVECQHCRELYFESDMESFFDEIDTDYDEGKAYIHNNYGYSEFSACPNCIDGIKEDIEQQRAEDYYHFMEEQEWYRKR